MNPWTSSEYEHILSPVAAQLFRRLHERIMDEFGNLKCESKSKTYISYTHTNSNRVRPFLYVVRRQPTTPHLVIRLEIAKGRLIELSNPPDDVRDELRINDKWKKNVIYTETVFGSNDYLADIMNLIRHTYIFHFGVTGLRRSSIAGSKSTNTLPDVLKHVVKDDPKNKALVFSYLTLQRRAINELKNKVECQVSERDDLISALQMLDEYDTLIRRILDIPANL